ncbi:putative reverse transcriptase domain-containing protein [Tanacetum coccineum]
MYPSHLVLIDPLKNIALKSIIQADGVDIQSKNVGDSGRYVRRITNNQRDSARNVNVQKDIGNATNVQRILITTDNSGNGPNVQCYNCNVKGHYTRDCPKPRVHDSKYFQEQMFLDKNDEAGIILNDEQNDFLLDTNLSREGLRHQVKAIDHEYMKTSCKIWYDEDVHDLRSVETEFPAIVLNDSLTSNETPSCEPTVSSINDEIDFRISFDESDDEDYTVVFDKNSFSYKMFSTNDLKTDSENDNEKVNKPLFPSPEPTVSCLNDLDFFKDVENEFPAIVYNDALTSKSDFLTEPTVSPQHR